MKWIYQCPECGEWRSIDWEKRKDSYKCHKDNSKTYFPPTPESQPSAYVDMHNWPVEMEEIVVSKKGKKCTVLGCNKKYETLDHRIPWAKDGKTSVDNLFPMCIAHNESKHDTDYQTWLKTLTKKNDK